MSTLQKVRTNDHIFELMEGDSSRYWAGYYTARRDHNMNLARRLRKADPALSQMFVNFARDDHRKYLGHLNGIRRAKQARARMASYQDVVLTRVLGVLQ